MTYIFEGNTTNSAIEKGLKELKVSKDKVDIKVLEEDKKSFFNILAPRVVKVEITLKEGQKSVKKSVNSSDLPNSVDEEDVKIQIEELEKFIKNFIEKLPNTNVTYKIEHSNNFINIDLNGENLKYLIGYRGETLNSLQNILKAISRRKVQNGAKIILNIEGYRSQREQILKELAEKISKTVIRTNKSVTLEPMSSYERKIIHSQLQNHDKVKTYSVGNEPNRRVVIAIK